MFNQKLVLFVCLAGLAFVVSKAAELPPANSQPSSSSFSIQVEPMMTDDSSEGENLDEDFMPEDMDMSEDGYDDNEDDLLDQEESLEEQLSDLAEEHFMVREDCKSIKGMIDESKQSGNSTVDPELLQAYEGCQKDLEDINTEMRSLTQQITAAA